MELQLAPGAQAPGEFSWADPLEAQLSRAANTLFRGVNRVWGKTLRDLANGYAGSTGRARPTRSSAGSTASGGRRCGTSRTATRAPRAARGQHALPRGQPRLGEDAAGPRERLRGLHGPRAANTLFRGVNRVWGKTLRDLANGYAGSTGRARPTRSSAGSTASGGRRCGTSRTATRAP